MTPTPGMPTTMTCPVCKGHGRLVCNHTEDCNHPRHISDTTYYPCARCNQRGIVPLVLEAPHQ